MTQIEKISYKGLNAIRMMDEDIQVIILPEWGSKIASIYDKEKQREWLHHNQNFAYNLPKYGSDYVGEYDIGGFDECFPNVAEGEYPLLPWQGVPLPDHGEVWSLPWEVKIIDDIVSLRVKGFRLPYILEKTCKLIGNKGLKITYKLENLSEFDLPFIWSSHPLLDIQPGMKLDIPAERVGYDNGNLLDAHSGETLDWPVHQGIDLQDILPREIQKAAKLYAAGLTEGIVGLTDSASNSRFEMNFDPGLITHVGLWLNYGGWSGKAGLPGYYNIGLEPCIGGADSLERAYEIGEFGLLKANDQISWWLEINVS